VHGTLDSFEELSPKAKAKAIREMVLIEDKMPFPAFSNRNIGSRIRHGLGPTPGVKN
jgi:hypothetical protein